MMTPHDIDSLSELEQAVTRASYEYYRALLSGAPKGKRERLRQAWLDQIQRSWPGVLNPT